MKAEQKLSVTVQGAKTLSYKSKGCTPVQVFPVLNGDTNSFIVCLQEVPIYFPNTH